MNKFLVTLAITFFLLSPLYPVSQANAADLTVSAYAGCQVRLGNTTNVGAGLRAAGGSAVISCPLEKVVGNNNLNFVFARINNAVAGDANSGCSLFRRGAFNTPANMTSRFAAPAPGNQSLNLPLPPLSSSGYLFLTCTLVNNDTFYGFRYGQGG